MTTWAEYRDTPIRHAAARIHPEAPWDRLDSLSVLITPHLPTTHPVMIAGNQIFARTREDLLWKAWLAQQRAQARGDLDEIVWKAWADLFDYRPWQVEQIRYWHDMAPVREAIQRQTFLALSDLLESTP